MQKTGTKPTTTANFEPHFTIPELSKLWNIDPGAVRQIFKDEPSVVRFRTAPQRYCIPESTAPRGHRRHSGPGEPSLPALGATKGQSL